MNLLFCIRIDFSRFKFILFLQWRSIASARYTLKKNIITFLNLLLCIFIAAIEYNIILLTNRFSTFFIDHFLKQLKRKISLGNKIFYIEKKLWLLSWKKLYIFYDTIHEFIRSFSRFITIQRDIKKFNTLFFIVDKNIFRI